MVTVADNGPGVSADQLEHLFERFYRVDASRTRTTGGAGLGLAIVEAIVHAHGGTVAAASPAGGGLTVRVVLPLAPRPSPDDV